jgi:hypothetical protein
MQAILRVAVENPEFSFLLSFLEIYINWIVQWAPAKM